MRSYYIVVLRVFYGWAAYKYKKDNLYDVNFFLKNIVKTKQQYTLPFVPSREDIEKLRVTLKTYKDILSYNTDSYTYKKIVLTYAIFELMITSGIRSQELRSLRKKDIDLENQTMWIRYGKGNTQRISLFGESACEILKEYFFINNFNDDDLIFPIKQGNILHYMIKRWARRAKIDKKIHIHSFRHYFITESERQGIPIEITANQVGHRDLNTTRHYTHLNLAFIKEKYKAIKI